MSNIYFYLLDGIWMCKHNPLVPSVAKRFLVCCKKKISSDFPFKFSMTQKTKGRWKRFAFMPMWTGCKRRAIVHFKLKRVPATVQLLSNKIKLNSRYFKFIMMLNSIEVCKATETFHIKMEWDFSWKKIHSFRRFSLSQRYFTSIPYVGVLLRFDCSPILPHFSHLLLFRWNFQVILRISITAIWYLLKHKLNTD